MKGNLGDIMAIMALAFGMIFTVMLAYPIASAFLTGLNNTHPLNSIGDLKVQLNKNITLLDMALPIFYVIFGVISIASASYINANPAFYFLLLVVNIIMLMGWSIINDIYTQMSTVSALSEVVSLFTYTPLLIAWMPKINIALMLLIAFVQYTTTSRVFA